MDGQALDALVVDGDLPCVGAQQAHNHVKRGGFACAVRPQQADHFTLCDGQRHVFNHLACAIGFLQARGFELA
jgi:hypothetical protein